MMEHAHKDNKSYIRLAGMIVLSFISMYIFMYSMVNSFADVYASNNQFYMAAVMTAPMVLIELVLMRDMYMNKKLNFFISIGSLLSLIIFFVLIRQQTGITDKQFLRSMIPHHSGAILMCEQSSAKNSAVVELCKTIISGQKAEIEQMRKLLQEIDR